MTLHRPMFPPRGESSGAFSANLVAQHRARINAIRRVSKLRQKAFAEIERLIAFIDASDEYVQTEAEPNGDELDTSYPHSGPRPASLGEDDEDTGDAEPSLGSSGHETGGPISYFIKAVSDGWQMIYDCEGDEHDGREPDCEDEGGQCDDEGVLE